MAIISKIKLPEDDTVYDIYDAAAIHTSDDLLYIVTATAAYDEELADTVWNIDKSFTDILAALQEGKRVELRESNKVYYCNEYYYDDYDNFGQIIFTNVLTEWENNYQFTFILNSDNTIEWYNNEMATKQYVEDMMSGNSGTNFSNTFATATLI